MRFVRRFYKLCSVAFFICLLPSDCFSFQETPSTEPVNNKKESQISENNNGFLSSLDAIEIRGLASLFRYQPDLNSESNINLRLGLEARLKVLPRVQVYSGISAYFIDVDFPIREEVFVGRTATGVLRFREHVSTNIQTIGLELPLGIKYSFNDKEVSPFITAGVVSRTSIRDRYIYNIDWHLGALSGSNFVANSTRSSFLSNPSESSFEFFNLFSSAALSIGTPVYFRGALKAEIMLEYQFNLSNMNNLFEERQYRQFESIGLTVKFPILANPNKLN